MRVTAGVLIQLMASMWSVNGPAALAGVSGAATRRVGCGCRGVFGVPQQVSTRILCRSMHPWGPCPWDGSSAKANVMYDSIGMAVDEYDLGLASTAFLAVVWQGLRRAQGHVGQTEHFPIHLNLLNFMLGNIDYDRIQFRCQDSNEILPSV
ncbi:hypothetical protein CRG98_039644 [Punica granatum]|uniref:Uncharacterized protein n=1 Tax=Punica granatum TaxID=22663 RepID=A0A2I0I7N2_PUNGR|nr:hypothetical protein CRG98_039644 [Punica granatum]